jgi:O-antigen/teichoic acid export membrane protein
MVMVLALFNISGAILIGFQRFKDYAWRISTGYALQFIAVWIGGTFFSLVGILIGLVIGPVVAASILLKGGTEAARSYGLKLHWKEYRWSWPVMRSILNFTVPSQIAGFIATPVLWLVYTILTLKKGFVEVGLFSAAFVFYQAVLFVAQSFSLPALPVLSEIQATADQARFNRALNKNLRASWSITLPICFMGATLGRTIVLLVYGKKYEAAGTMILFTSFSALWSVMFYALSVAVSSLGKMWDILFFNIFWSAIALALSWKWSAAHGSMGVAAAYFMSYLLLVIVTLPYSAWRFGFRFEGILRMVIFSLVTLEVAYVVTFHSSQLASWVLFGLLGPTLIWAEWNWMLDEEDHHFIKSSTLRLTSRFVFKARGGRSKLRADAKTTIH